MRTEQKVFNDLIETIVRNSENNIATITDVKLWAKNWQTEMEQELTLTDVCCSLPSKNERVKYCNDLANKHGVTEIFKRETLIKGFHLGFRYAKSFIK